MTRADIAASTDASASSRRASARTRRVVSSEVRPVQSAKVGTSIVRRERDCAAAAAASSSMCRQTGQRPSLRNHSPRSTQSSSAQVATLEAAASGSSEEEACLAKIGCLGSTTESKTASGGQEDAEGAGVSLEKGVTGEHGNARDGIEASSEDASDASAEAGGEEETDDNEEVVVGVAAAVAVVVVVV
eukprot:scaffold167562_cov33-Tisochrysis_lutea.AAC.7